MWEWLNSLPLNQLQSLNHRLFFWTALSGVLTGGLGLAIWRINSRIDALQTEQTLRSERSIAEIQQENLKLQVRVEELKNDNLRLQTQVENNRATVDQHLADRKITEPQGKILEEVLARLKLTLLVVSNNREAARFGDKLHAVMSRSGLDVSSCGCHG